MGWWRKRKKPLSETESKSGAMLLEELIKCCDGKSNPIKFFSADEILKASDNFSNFVSELYNFGYEWYSGNTDNHHNILIKRSVVKFHAYQEGNFCRDIAVSSMVSGHKNFLKLVGCCLEFKYPIIVYRSVKKHYRLDDISKQLWKGRMKIVEDIATALAYLHTAFPRPFVYRNLSLGKILLDEDGVAKLIDFNFCVSIPEGETFVKVDKIVGLYGYQDNKYIRAGKVSEKTDVFAIGMIMQKLIMGQYQELYAVEEEDAKEEGDGEGDDDDDDTTDNAIMSTKNYPGRQFQFRLLKLIEDRRMDPVMVEKMGEISEQELCQMKAFGMLSLRCVGRREEVPTMVEVAKELKKIQRSLRNDCSSSFR